MQKLTELKNIRHRHWDEGTISLTKGCEHFLVESELFRLWKTGEENDE
jgi:hypothetical protein